MITGSSKGQEYKSLRHRKKGDIKVYLKVEGIQLDLISEARSGNKAILLSADVISTECAFPATSQAISFDGNFYIKLPAKDLNFPSASLTFLFQTNEHDGTLLCGSSLVTRSRSQVVFSMFISKRVVSFYYDSSGNVSVTNLAVLNEYRTYQVSINMSYFLLTVSLERKILVFEIFRSIRDKSFVITLGGGCEINAEHNNNNRHNNNNNKHNKLHRFNHRAKHNFRGCIRNLLVDWYSDVNVSSFFKSTDSSKISANLVRPCEKFGPKCSSHPCLHGGVCREGWNRFICDCSRTGFRGINCANSTKKFKFSDNSHLVLSSDQLNSPDSVSFRFLTHVSSFHLTTCVLHSEGHISLFVKHGALYVHEKIREVTKTVNLKRNLAKNKWYQLGVRCDSSVFFIGVDEQSIYENDVGAKMITRIILGGSFAVVISYLQNDTKSIVLPPKVTFFEGLVEQILINEEECFETPSHYFELVDRSVAPEMLEEIKPLTFASSTSFVVFHVETSRLLRFSFQFKTMMQNCIMFFVRDSRTSYILLELIESTFHFRYDNGLESQKINIHTETTLNDNAWHQFSMEIFNGSELLLKVNDFIHFHYFFKKVQVHHPFRLFLGGLPKMDQSSVTRKLSVSPGYQGCIGKLDVGNGELDLADSNAIYIPQEFAQKIHVGCFDPPDMCQSIECKNKGRCRMSWDSFSCDCQMTSFAGEFCDEESIGFAFHGGILVVNVSPEDQTDLKHDRISLGLISSAHNGTILSIISSISKDFIKIELVNGSVVASYNLGLGDHVIWNSSCKVNDGNYHVIQFIRSGVNSTLIVDGQHVGSLNPKGHQMNIFNKQSKMIVGGTSDSINSSPHLLVGNLFGLEVNKLAIFDMAKSRDQRIKIFGGVSPRQTPEHRRTSTDIEDISTPGHSTCDDEDSDCTFSGQDYSDFGRARVNENSFTILSHPANLPFSLLSDFNNFSSASDLNVLKSTKQHQPTTEQILSDRFTMIPFNDSLFKSFFSNVVPERRDRKLRLYNSFVMNVTLIISILLAICTLAAMMVYVLLKRIRGKSGVLPQNPLKKTSEPLVRGAFDQQGISQGGCLEVQKHVREWYV